MNIVIHINEQYQTDKYFIMAKPEGSRKKKFKINEFESDYIYYSEVNTLEEILKEKEILLNQLKSYKYGIIDNGINTKLKTRVGMIVKLKDSRNWLHGYINGELLSKKESEQHNNKLWKITHIDINGDTMAININNPNEIFSTTSSVFCIIMQEYSN